MKKIISGKVREVYDLEDGRMVIVTTDRISAFDVILPTMITDKGKVLNALSNFWFDLTKDITKNHMISSDLKDMPAEFIIPNGKVQSAFHFSMSNSGDPSTFTFTVDAFPAYPKFSVGKENKKVLCDCHLTVAQAFAFSEPARVVFLIKDPSNLVDEYGNRPDHQGFFQYLNSATDIEKAKQTVNTTLYELNANRIEEIKSSSFFWLERTVDSTVDGTLACVEKHLALI